MKDPEDETFVIRLSALLKAQFSRDEDCRRRVRKLYELELEAAKELKDKI